MELITHVLMGIVVQIICFILFILIIYILLPVDLIPELFGPAGILDDLLLAGGLFYYLRSLSRKKLETGKARRRPDGDGSDRQSGYSNKETPQKGEKRTFDPYEIIGVPKGRPLEDIQKKYKEQLLKYHPDRTQHLGRELQELASEVTEHQE